MSIINLESRVFSKKYNKIDLTFDNFDFLLAENILVELENDSHFKYEKSEIFEFPLYMNNRTYDLSAELYAEVYLTMKFEVEEIWGVDGMDIYEIEANLKSYLDNAEKLRYLQQKHREIYENVLTEHEYNIYLGIDNVYVVGNWAEYSRIVICDNLEIVKKYLVSEIYIGDIPDRFREAWKIYYYTNAMCNFISNKIEELKNVVDRGELIAFNSLEYEIRNKSKRHKKQKFSLANEIKRVEISKTVINDETLNSDFVFAGQGKIIFDKIRDNYKLKITKAFYTYLYFYLLRNSYILDENTTDNGDYRAYVLRNLGVDLGTRLQPRNKDGKTELKRFKMFNNILDRNLTDLNEN